MNTKTYLICLSFLLTIYPPTVLAGSPKEDATKAIEDWLFIVDMEQYYQSWEKAANAFKKTVSAKSWNQSMLAYRAPLGQVLSRKTTSTVFHTSLHGAPDGEYIVIQFETSFENKNETIETVTSKREENGRWYILGYNIR